MKAVVDWLGGRAVGFDRRHGGAGSGPTGPPAGPA